MEWTSPTLQICLSYKRRGFGSSVKMSAVTWRQACAHALENLDPCCRVFCGASSSHGGKGSRECGSWNPGAEELPLLSGNLAMWPWTRFFPSLGISCLICKTSTWTGFSPLTLLAWHSLIFWSWLRPKPKVKRNSATLWVSWDIMLSSA